MSRSRSILLPFVLLVVGFSAGLVLSGRTRLTGESVTETAATAPAATSTAAAATAPAPPPSPAGPPPPVVVGPDFTHIAGQAIKGVANISSQQVVARSRSPFEDDPFFSYFFGGQDVFGPRTRRALSLGSGVIVSADGYVVTNNHVVGENVREILVALPDKRELRGKVIGTDPATDIALLKIDVSGLTKVPWGDSSALQVGEWVLAIGSPFQLSQTVTAGIISATGRANMGFAEYEDFIQTDAAINPGNSGGALINGRGELVGINTGIFSQSGGYQGIGFAVPSNLAKHVIDDLMKYGSVRRGRIADVTFEPLTDRYAQELGAPNTNGALVTSMQRRSAAYEAGLKPGDIIVGVNGQPVTTPSDLYRHIADAKIGTVGVLRVLRDRRTIEIRVPITAEAGGRRN
jgi:Do/DeqQ family serine protease